MHKILLVIPHNPIWVGSKEKIIEHPALYRKLKIFSPYFNNIIVFRGGKKTHINKISNILENDISVIDYTIGYKNLVFFTFSFIVKFTSFLYQLNRVIKNKQGSFFLLTFNHTHKFSLYSKIISRLFGINIISFYVNTPYNSYEKASYFISKNLDTISIVIHPLIAKELGIKRYFIIPNLPDDYFFKKKTRRSQNKRNILMISRLTWEKNVDVAILLLYIIKKLGKDMKLYIVGDGPLRIYLEKISDHLGLLNKNVFFIGHKDTKDVSRLMENNSFLLHTSTLEYLPNVIVEGLASNLLVLTFDTEAYRWIIKRTILDQKSLVKSAKKIISLAENENLYLEALAVQKNRFKYLIHLYHSQIYQLGKFIENLEK